MSGFSRLAQLPETRTLSPPVADLLLVCAGREAGAVASAPARRDHTHDDYCFSVFEI